MAGEDNQILLRMVIRGMDPSAVREMARQTYGQLRDAAAGHLDNLAALHAQKQTEMGEATKKRVDAEIKEQTKALGNVTALMRQAEIEQNKMHANWRRTLEDLENITTVARGAFDVIIGGLTKFKQLADQIATTQNVYGSLAGSIEEMREASNGEISDMDLILTKNRAMQKELQLTDQQFGMVAAAADEFADSLGTNTKEALDSLIDGLANGNTKMLKSAGVIVDTDKAYVDYAEKIGVATNRLTDHEKKLAIVEAGLRGLDEKTVRAGVSVTTFASNWDKTMAQIANVTDKAMLWIGDQIQDFIAHWQRIPDNIRIMIGKVKDLFPGQNGNAQAATEEALQNQAARDNADAVRAKAKFDAAQGRLNTPGAYDQKRDAAEENVLRDKQFAKKGAANDNAYDPFAAPDKREGHKATVGGLAGYTEDLPGFSKEEMADSPGAEDYVKAQDAKNAADEKRAVIMAKVAAEHRGLEGVTVNEQVAYAKLAETLGIHADALTHEEKMQAIAAEAAVQTQEALLKAEEQAKKMREELEATGEKAGFLGYFLFGPDGPEQTFNQMDESMRHVVESFGAMSDMIGGSAKKMSDALAKTVVASITGSKQQAHALKQATHDILESLAQQAIAQAIMETAMGIGSLAMYNFPAAALHFAAAAAYGVLGVSAALGAKAVGNPAANAAADQERADAQKAKGGGSMSSGRSSDFGSGSRDGAGTVGEQSPITFNMTVMPGGEAEAGRSVRRALDALEAKEGATYARAS